jgi:hypothetical protein
MDRRTVCAIARTVRHRIAPSPGRQVPLLGRQPGPRSYGPPGPEAQRPHRPPLPAATMAGGLARHPAPPDLQPVRHPPPDYNPLGRSGECGLAWGPATLTEKAPECPRRGCGGGPASAPTCSRSRPGNPRLSTAQPLEQHSPALRSPHDFLVQSLVTWQYPLLPIAYTPAGLFCHSKATHCAAFGAGNRGPLRGDTVNIVVLTGIGAETALSTGPLPLVLQQQLGGSALTPTHTQREREICPFPLDGGRLGWG